jgi:hypothetical protein
MSHEVFISYSSLDKSVADSVCLALEASGTNCWIAPRDVMPGKPYGEALIDAINDSHIMVLVLSEHSNHSTQVVREVERAVSKGIPIIPLRIANVRLAKSLEYFLSTCHWLDAIGEKIEPHLPRLTEAVNETLRKVYDGETLSLEQRAAPPKTRRSAAQEQLAAIVPLVETSEVYQAQIVRTTPESPTRPAIRPPANPNPNVIRSYPQAVRPNQPPPYQAHGQQPPHPPAFLAPPAPPRTTNALGVAGLTTSIIGIFTCGTFSPIGLFLSLLGLLKAPRGNAVAGSIIGAIGSGVFLAMFCYGFYGGFMTALTLEDAASKIDSYRADMGEIPDTSVGSALLESDKDAWNNELRYSRTWNGFEIRSAGVDGVFDTLDDHTVLR